MKTVKRTTDMIEEALKQLFENQNIKYDVLFIDEESIGLLDGIQPSVSAKLVNGEMVIGIDLYNARKLALITLPDVITDYVIIGWEHCTDCKKLKYIADLSDYITLRSGGGCFITTEIKKKFLKLGYTPTSFPVLMKKDGTQVIDTPFAMKMMGLKVIEKKEPNEN